MTVTDVVDGAAEATRLVPNRVPQPTWEFWAVKLLAVTMGETAADFLADRVGLGMPLTGAIMIALLALALRHELRQKRYVPWIYWVTVVLVSIVGTLVSDALVDALDVSLWTTTTVFGAALAATFALWWRAERTLSIHTIVTDRRERFYWAAILLTFALGTSAGDLASEVLGWGYLETGLIAGAIVAATAIAWKVSGLDPILAFWVAYVVTRPLGGSFGDLFAQMPQDGGLGFGTVWTSVAFLLGIIGLVAWISATHDGEEIVPAAR